MQRAARRADDLELAFDRCAKHRIGKVVVCVLSATKRVSRARAWSISCRYLRDSSRMKQFA
jgi:hypothetical protein